MTIIDLNVKINKLQRAADELRKANVEAERGPRARWMALSHLALPG